MSLLRKAVEAGVAGVTGFVYVFGGGVGKVGAQVVEQPEKSLCEQIMGVIGPGPYTLAEAQLWTARAASHGGPLLPEDLGYLSELTFDDDKPGPPVGQASASEWIAASQSDVGNRATLVGFDRLPKRADGRYLYKCNGKK